MSSKFASVIARLVELKSKCFQLLVIVAIITVFVKYELQTEDQAVFPLHFNTKKPHEISLSVVDSTKIVLMVNPIFWGFRFKMGRLGFVNAGCEVNNCMLTTNHSYVKDNKFDAFIIHEPTRTTSLWTRPNRTREQIFIMFSTEPPGVARHSDHMPRWKSSDNYFNWTMSYLPESDIHLPYGRIEPLPGAPKNKSELNAILEQFSTSNVNPAKGKTKLAIWLVSNCKSGSNRMEYVRKLQKYIDIDIVSEKDCGNKKLCKREEYDECIDIIEQTYKFYIAFENSICREYVTEKFYNSIGRNIVPIVLGGANYREIAPHNSYINALDYSPRQLAEYLQKLDQDDSLYAQYFWWKPYYRVLNLIQMNDEAFCKLCAALHVNPIEEKVAIPDRLNKWYFDNSRCRKNPWFW